MKRTSQSPSHIYTKKIGKNEVNQLTSTPKNDIHPVWSPDGRYIAFTREKQDPWHQEIYLISPLGGKEYKVHSRASFGKLDWSPDGKKLAFNKIDSNGFLAISLLSLETGETQWLTSVSASKQTLRDKYASFSPDGSRLAFVREVGYPLDYIFRNYHTVSLEGDIYIVTIDSGKMDQLTFDYKYVNGLTWTPDGNEIIFSSTREGLAKLYRIQTKGGSIEIIPSSDHAYYPVISPDGRSLIYLEREPTKRYLAYSDSETARPIS